MDLGSILLSATTGGQESTDMAAAAEAGHGGDRESDVIFFIFSSLCLGGIVKEINKKTAVNNIYLTYLYNFRYHTPQCYL